jgi:hypothetical protein
LNGEIADWKAKRTLHAAQELQSETETNAATKETIYICNSKRLRQIFINNFYVYKKYAASSTETKRRGRGASGWDKMEKIPTAANMVISQDCGALDKQGYRIFKTKQNSSTTRHFMCSVHSNNVWCYN